MRSSGAEYEPSGRSAWPPGRSSVCSRHFHDFGADLKVRRNIPRLLRSFLPPEPRGHRRPHGPDRRDGGRVIRLSKMGMPHSLPYGHAATGTSMPRGDESRVERSRMRERIPLILTDMYKLQGPGGNHIRRARHRHKEKGNSCPGRDGPTSGGPLDQRALDPNHVLNPEDFRYLDPVAAKRRSARRSPIPPPRQALVAVSAAHREGERPVGILACPEPADGPGDFGSLAAYPMRPSESSEVRRR